MNPRLQLLDLRRESWPLRAAFTISRGSRVNAEVLYLQLGRGPQRGHAECVPYARYGESFDSVTTQVREAVERLADIADPRAPLGEILPAGAARNLVDCAVWDLLCKERGLRAWQLAGRGEPTRAVTVETVVIDSPQAMGAAAAAAANRPVLKIKLDADLVIERVAAVHAGAPHSELVVDANEAWSLELLREVAAPLAGLGVTMIEQPLPAGADEALHDFDSPVPLCADESCHTTADLERCAQGYQMVNLKLDKTGGLTEALRLTEAAPAWGLQLMVGCMLGTSLAMAPATLVADRARVVDLDGPLWMAEDRQPALVIEDSRVGLPTAELWG